MSRLSHLVGLEPPYEEKRYRVGNPDRKAYTCHRANAKMRGIEFKLTFEEWFCWWMDTGHYHERGRAVGQYVMGRIGDIGPYELGNIECVQAQVNSTAAHLGKKRSAETKTRISDSQSKRWAAKRARIST